MRGSDPTRRTRPSSGDSLDRTLVARARAGDPGALDALLRRHQAFLHGLMLRMLWLPEDAEDATQEVLIKLVTRLSSYRGLSAFRTWAYRIAVRHALNWRRGRVERRMTSFEEMGRRIDDLPDLDPSGLEAGLDRRVLEEETRIACLSGMLLCLDRPQRVVLVLAEVFDLDHVQGSQVLGITRDNFRQRLARARRQLYAFLRGKCGLADPANPCRCARKTRAAIRAGYVDPVRLRFVDERLARVKRSAPARSRALARGIDARCAELFRDRDRRAAPDLVARVRSVLADRGFRSALELDDAERPGPPLSH